MNIERNDKPSWLVKKRSNMFNKFLHLSTPSFKYGLHIFLNFELDFHTFVMDHLIKSSKVDKDRYNEYGSQINSKHIKKIFTLIEENKFSTLNSSLAKINIIKIGKNSDKNFKLNIEDQFTHTLILVGENSKVNFFEEVNQNYFYGSNFVEIFAEKNSKVNFVSLQKCRNRYYVSGKYASILTNAKVNWLDINLSSNFVKSDVISFLNGRNSETNNCGMFIGKENQQFDIYSSVIHKKRDTKSNILIKGTLKDKAKSVCRGLVKIKSNAKNSDGYQKEEILLLNNGAEADAIPKLEIENEDVRCTHGASIGHLDEEKLFYIMSRGVEKNAAIKLMVKGFFESLIQKFDEGWLRKMLIKNFNI